MRGKPVDDQTRCAHWHGEMDVVAFRFPCCDGWWPCHTCHAEVAGHQAKPWPKSRGGEKSVMCGVCTSRMTGAEYRASDNRCPSCGHGFNPGCKAHWPQYFEL